MTLNNTNIYAELSVIFLSTCQFYCILNYPRQHHKEKYSKTKVYAASHLLLTWKILVKILKNYSI